MSRNSRFSSLFSSNFKQVEGDQFSKNQNSLMGGSDLFQNNSNQQQSCGLARYGSAPGSFLVSLLESGNENGSSGDEAEAFFSDLMNSGPLDLNQKNYEPIPYFMKREKPEIRPREDGLSGGHMVYERTVNGGGGAVVGSYSVGMESQLAVKGNNVCSNLSRQSSSPAGFFSGFGATGKMGNFGVQNHAEPNSSSPGSLSNHMKLSMAPSSASRFMPSIPEGGNESLDTRSPENGGLSNCNGVNGREYEPPFPHDSWNDISQFNSLKRSREGEPKMFSDFSGLENSNEETVKKSPGLVRHLSLPKTAAPMPESPKFLHFQQETVPCQIRAKRGFATHPRSIAERMRRTRISEKMKKLQDLFPNMDKQTNTADMLDLAVEYIKDLQTQVKTLTESRAKCICSSKPEPASSMT